MSIFGIIENMNGFTCPHCGNCIEGQGGVFRSKTWIKQGSLDLSHQGVWVKVSE